MQKERSLDDEQVMLSEGDTPSPKATRRWTDIGVGGRSGKWPNVRAKGFLSIVRVQSKADDAGALVPFKTPREVCLVDPSWTSKLVWDIYVMCSPQIKQFIPTWRQHVHLALGSAVSTATVSCTADRLVVLMDAMVLPFQLSFKNSDLSC